MKMTYLLPNLLPNASNREQRSQLTNREQEVMALVRQGLSNKEVARELHIRDGTVKMHVHNILTKVGVRNRRGLITQARVALERVA